MLVLGATGVGACGEKPTKPAPAAQATQVAPPVPAPSVPVPSVPVPSVATQAGLVGVVGAYERIRVALADDAIASALEGAAALELTATEAAQTAEPTLGTMLREIAKAAAGLKASSASDADAVRRAFGEVSRGVVALVGAVTSLRAGHYMFECPMAQDYKRWVQASDHIANPYMGKSMLECGASRAWPNGS